jgi:hypothetical protein
MSMPTQQRLIVLLGCCLALASSATFAQHAYDVNIVKEIFGFDSKTPKSIPFRDLHQGCPTRDAFRRSTNRNLSPLPMPPTLQTRML